MTKMGKGANTMFLYFQIVENICDITECADCETLKTENTFTVTFTATHSIISLQVLRRNIRP